MGGITDGDRDREPGLPWELCLQLSVIENVLLLLFHAYLLQNTLCFKECLLIYLCWSKIDITVCLSHLT